MLRWPGHTIAGCHGLPNPTLAAAFGVEMVRIIRNGYDFLGPDPPITEEGVQDLFDEFWAAPHHIGVYLTIRWEANDPQFENPPSVPQAQEFLQVLQSVAASPTGLEMAAAGKFIIAGANEFAGGIGVVRPGVRDQWFLWLEGLSEAVRGQNPDILIGSPSMTTAPVLQFPPDVLNRNQTYQRELNEQMLRFATALTDGRPNCDLIDVHAFGRDRADWVRRFTVPRRWLQQNGLAGRCFFTSTESGIANFADRSDTAGALREQRRIWQACIGADPITPAEDQLKHHSIFQAPTFPNVNLNDRFQWSHTINTDDSPHEPWYTAVREFNLSQRRRRKQYVGA